MVDTQSLSSWNDGAVKSAILDFVARTTKEGSADFVPPAERISTFDMDGTLWCERPLQVQVFFLFDRVKELSAKDPALVERLPFKAVLEHDYNTLFRLGKQAVFELVFATHAGMTDEDFDRVARGWLATAKHPKVDRLFKECVYRPQVELLAYLRENGFKSYIVTGSGIEFVRAFAEEVDGIPREQVIGSSGKMRYDVTNDRVSFSARYCWRSVICGRCVSSSENPSGICSRRRLFHSSAAVSIRWSGSRSTSIATSLS
jgi:hypothetical protein